MTQDWAQTLFEIYNLNRDQPEWFNLVLYHDDEDREYFKMLDHELMP